MTENPFSLAAAAKRVPKMTVKAKAAIEDKLVAAPHKRKAKSPKRALDTSKRAQEALDSIASNASVVPSEDEVNTEIVVSSDDETTGTGEETVEEELGYYLKAYYIQTTY